MMIQVEKEPDLLPASMSTHIPLWSFGLSLQIVEMPLVHGGFSVSGTEASHFSSKGAFYGLMNCLWGGVVVKQVVSSFLSL